jgi:hypothetical protein
VVIPLSGRVPGRASRPSRSRLTMVAAYSRFRGKLIGVFRFSRRGEFIGGRAASGSGPGAHTRPQHGQGVARTMGWYSRPLAPLRLCFGLRHAPGKIGTSAFVLSNSENISCVAFLKHKDSKNGELALWHLVNRLVLENA